MGVDSFYLVPSWIGITLERYEDEAVRIARRIAAGHHHHHHPYHRRGGGGGAFSPGPHTSSPERLDGQERIRSGSGESTLTLTLRHSRNRRSRSRRGDPTATGPLLPPPSTLSKPPARKALLAHGPAPSDLSDGLLELGGDAGKGQQQQQQQKEGTNGEGDDEGDGVGEALAVAEAKQRAHEAESREKAARMEVSVRMGRVRL